MKLTRHLFILALIAIPAGGQAAESVELDSIYIKGNKEFPQILYIVPWKDMKAKGHREQTLVLHSLFGDLFNPVYDEVMPPITPPAAAGKRK